MGLSILRELGPILTCLMLAGRVGSGVAAEIGSMKVTQQIDAIRALGTDPIKRIVVPRVLAMVLIAPMLTLFADIVGILGGIFIAYVELNIDPTFYFHEALVGLRPIDFVVGISKTVLFGLTIGATGCYYGLSTEGRHSRGRTSYHPFGGHCLHSDCGAGFYSDQGLVALRAGHAMKEMPEKDEPLIEVRDLYKTFNGKQVHTGVN